MGQQNTCLAASAAGSAEAKSPKPPVLDHGATSVETKTTCNQTIGTQKSCSLIMPSKKQQS